MIFSVCLVVFAFLYLFSVNLGEAVSGAASRVSLFFVIEVLSFPVKLT